MVTKRISENANKVTFIIQQYPEKNIREVINMFQLPAIDINTAIWHAQDLGWLTRPDDKDKDGKVEVKNPPEEWNFGDIEGDLEQAIMYAFNRVAEKETDLEEQYIGQWMAGYATQDVLIAMRRLLNTGKLAEYIIDDPVLNKKGKPVKGKDGEPLVEHYTFYTLPENIDKKWGQKQFKRNPLEEQPTSEK